MAIASARSRPGSLIEKVELHAFTCTVETLRGCRECLPACASTLTGGRAGILDSREACSDFAEACHDLGFRAFKNHGRGEGDAREEAALILHGARQIGDRMALMYDAASERQGPPDERRR